MSKLISVLAVTLAMMAPGVAIMGGYSLIASSLVSAACSLFMAACLLDDAENGQKPNFLVNVGATLVVIGGSISAGFIIALISQAVF